MRVTTAGQTNAIIARLQASQQRLAEAQERATSGVRVARMSDDPMAGSGIMRASGGLRGVDQYTRNAARAADSLNAEDGALTQVTDLLARARELATAGNSDNVDAAGRAASAAEVRQLLEQAVQIGNTKYGDEYLFGGENNDGRPPFDAAATQFVVTDPDPNGGPAVPRYPAGTRRVEVGAGGQTIAGAHDGSQIFLGVTAGGQPDPTTGVLGALRQLDAALTANDRSAVAASMTTLDAASDALQSAVGELGARQNHADAVQTGLAAVQSALTERKSGLREEDMEQAVTEMLARQTAYQAAMLASSKVMGLSLADYLK